MLSLSLPKIDVWDEKKEEFKQIGGQEVELEHSLYTIAGWEAKWKTPFANKKGLSREQLISYITEFMCQTDDVPKSSWLTLNDSHYKKIMEYMEDSQTATTIKKMQTHTGGRHETVTAEVLYFYMAQFNIPPQYDRWHLNRLMTLIDVCAVKSAPPKKMGRKEAAQMQAAQNASLRAKLGSRG